MEGYFESDKIGKIKWKLSDTKILELPYKDGHVEDMKVRYLTLWKDKKQISINGFLIFPIEENLANEFTQSDIRTEVINYILSKSGDIS